MHKLYLYLVITILGLFFVLVNGQKNLNSTKKVPDVSPAVKETVLVYPEYSEFNKNLTKLGDKIKSNCKHTDYRTYVECMLEESKRKKRQGYQQPCPGNGCPSTNQQQQQQQQQCIGTGCLQFGQQQQCVGNGCLQTVQQPCFGTGCIFFGQNCGGNGCTQIGQNCHGVGCVPSCSGTPCNTPSPISPAPQIRPVGDEFRRDIEKITEELGLVKRQNEILIKSTETATSFILQLLNRPNSQPKVVREPVLVGHNSTTNIEISNYLNNTNVVNVPEIKNDVILPKSNTSHCCIVVRPKTCRRTVKPPYFSCSHRKHRTCGPHCSKKRVLYSHVKSGCTGDNDENCVSYHPYPHNPTYTGYPTSGYYPPTPMYYPTVGAQYYPMYAPPQIPIYSQPPIYLTHDEVDDCDDCESEVETVDCEETEEDCNSDGRQDDRGDQHPRVRGSRNVHLGEIIEIKKEAEAMKRSEDQLVASVKMLREAVELEKLEEKRKEEKISTKNIGTVSEDVESLGTTSVPSSFLYTKSV